MGRAPKEPSHALGDLDTPDRDISAMQDRSLFLRTIQRLCPSVVRSLPSGSTEAEILAWAERHHLAEPWIIKAARDTVEARRVIPTWTPGKWCLNAAVTVPDPIGGDNEDQADPFVSTRAEYLASPRKRGHGERHWDLSVRKAKSEGAVSAKHTQQTHIDWTVRFQVGCEGFSRIARDPSGSAQTPASKRAETTPATIERAVKSFAAFIGLTLRHAPMGGARQRKGVANKRSSRSPLDVQ